jgi:2-polyprenyl-3-methyl-5-hydroxy-6-metoxy-1,4-benzoquinol methylase
MTIKNNLETISCPFCGANSYTSWAVELGFTAVRCNACLLVYCNPRPVQKLIDAAVRTGTHSQEAQGLIVTSRRIGSKVGRYKRVFRSLFDDYWKSGQPVSWLDVGAGYGEVLEAVTALAAEGSRITGLEPMHPKAEKARQRGLTIIEDYLRPDLEKVQIISVVDVFSHIPDFRKFLTEVRAVLQPGGSVFIETGNMADLEDRKEFPGELGLPDHLVFVGEKQLLGYLNQGGFEVLRLQRKRIDGVVNLLKNIVKKLLGRPAVIAIPYTSKYRQLLVRARMKAQTD